MALGSKRSNLFLVSKCDSEKDFLMSAISLTKKDFFFSVLEGNLTSAVSSTFEQFQMATVASLMLLIG